VCEVGGCQYATLCGFSEALAGAVGLKLLQRPSAIDVRANPVGDRCMAADVVAFTDLSMNDQGALIAPEA
jgi:hypothetical protein